MTKKIMVRLVFAIITSIFVFVTYCGVSIWSYSNQVQLVKTDVAIVLGAAAWNSEPSPVLRERINHAIWLYENGYVSSIIFTGGKGDGDQYAESEVARNYAILHHVNTEHIFIETSSKITEENLTHAYEIATENLFTTFMIVSDPLHMKRAMLMAEQMGMDAYSSPTQSSAYKSLNSKIPFFFRELFFYSGYIISLPFR